MSGTRCKTCLHPERNAIDEALLARTGVRVIAARFGLGKSSVHDHLKNGHIAEKLAKAAGAAEVAEADALLLKIHGLEADARRIGRAAEKAGNHQVAINAVRELVRIVELVARLTGDLKPEVPAGGYVFVFEGGVPKALPEAAIETTATRAIEATAGENNGE